MKASTLMSLKRIAAVTAHPDDESFGLGAVIGALVANGTQISLTCLTRGEATTLGKHGHIDHHLATCAALDAAGRRDLPVVGWCIEKGVARSLNTEFGTRFAGVGEVSADLSLTVERQGQRAAMECHASQLTGNPIPLRRLELQGNREYLRLLRGSFDQRRRINKRPFVDWS